MHIRSARSSDAPELMKLNDLFNGAVHFHLATGDDNAAAQALYRSCGYERTSVMLEKDVSSETDNVSQGKPC